jgi:hypothetical protein
MDEDPTGTGLVKIDHATHHSHPLLQDLKYHLKDPFQLSFRSRSAELKDQGQQSCTANRVLTGGFTTIETQHLASHLSRLAPMAPVTHSFAHAQIESQLNTSRAETMPMQILADGQLLPCPEPDMVNNGS